MSWLTADIGRTGQMMPIRGFDKVGTRLLKPTTEPYVMRQVVQLLVVIRTGLPRLLSIIWRSAQVEVVAEQVAYVLPNLVLNIGTQTQQCLECQRNLFYQ